MVERFDRYEGMVEEGLLEAIMRLGADSEMLAASDSKWLGAPRPICRRSEMLLAGVIGDSDLENQ
jgi:hypothetical protein